MSFLQGLGGPLAGALGGAINPASGAGMAGGPLSGIGALKALIGGGGGSDTAPTSAAIANAPAPAAPVGADAPQANVMATGLGKLIGVDPGKISSIAGNIGKGMNQIAAAGGAQGGYEAPAMQAPQVNNHMQLLDPAVLRALVQYFGGQRQ